MGSSIEVKKKPHAVCIPFPGQGHIISFFQLAKLLHGKGFHITFVNTEFNHKRLIESRGSSFLDGQPSFRFEAIPDGLPAAHIRDSDSLYVSTATTCFAPFKELLVKLNGSSNGGPPPVSCIISDRFMSFTLDAAEMLAIPEFIVWTINPRSILGLAEGGTLADKGYLPLKDANCMPEGYLDTMIEDIPSLKGMRLRDLPGFITRADANPKEQANFFAFHDKSQGRAMGFIVNTFEDLDRDVLNALRSMAPSVYAIGPLNLLDKLQADEEELGLNMWKEEAECLEWLDSKDSNSVIYVSFGTTTTITHPNQVIEFAWGLANSNHPFLWAIRTEELVFGGQVVQFPQEFLESIKERGMLVKWCPQEKVLAHPSVGGFLTHSGWNSVLESISSGIPMICFSGFEDHPPIRWSCCRLWGIGMELHHHDVNRDEVERLVREMLTGDKGKELKKKAMEWKKVAHESGKNSSLQNLDNLINQVLNFSTPSRVNLVCV